MHDFPAQVRSDKKRDAVLRKKGYRILRVPNGIVMKAPDEFAAEIE